MRILMISDVYFPRVNGVSTSIYTFRQCLIDKGHQVTLVVPEYPESIEDDESIIRISSRFVPFDPEDRMMKYREVLKIVPQLRSLNFDVLHIQTPFVAYYAGEKLADLLSIPTVITYHTLFEEYLYNYIEFLPKSWLRALARRFSTNQCNKVDSVIVPSSAIEKRLAEYGVNTPMARLPTGIDLSRFSKGDGDRFREAYGIPFDRPVMMYIGRVAHEKNIDFLVEVTANVKEKIPNILLVVAGEGPAENHIRQLVLKYDLIKNVMFVGYLDRLSELCDCYRAGDVFVFSSRTETQGLVLLEAMALGVPVVSTAILGTADVLTNGDGAIIADDNIEHFSYSVTKLLLSPELQQTLSKKGIEYVKNWGSDESAKRLLEHYEEVVSRSQCEVERLLPIVKDNG